MIQRILDAWEDNRIHETEVGGHRKGHMGHLTLIANQIMENMDKGINAERIKMFIGGKNKCINGFVWLWEGN